MTTLKFKLAVIFMALVAIYLYRWQRIRVKVAIRSKLTVRRFMLFVFWRLYKLTKYGVDLRSGMASIGWRGNWLFVEWDYYGEWKQLQIGQFFYTHTELSSRFSWGKRQLLCFKL